MGKRRESSFIHSIKVDDATCIGCVACMKVCPTKAIRLRGGKAHINYERCIDCGGCLRICPHHAVIPVTTSPSDLNRFNYKIALPSPVVYSQFGSTVMPSEILTILTEIGFDHVYDEALVCEMVSVAIEEYLDENKSPRPIISSTCPVVVRLIQRLFPSLCKNILPLEPPREIAAKNLRSEAMREKKIAPEEIGIIDITPCSARMVSISHPETMEKSNLDGAIPIKDIYNKVMLRLKRSMPMVMMQSQTRISGIGIGWAIEGGEIRGLKYTNSVSVSGVLNTIRLLQDVESGRLKNIEYLECLICPDGCIGGPLTVENRFIAKSNVLRLIRHFGGKKRVSVDMVKTLYRENFFSFKWAVEPKSFPPLDKDRNVAILKLKQKEELLKRLPGTDCGVCGAPDCTTLAEDIVRGESKIEDCIYIKKKSSGEMKNSGDKK
ncbi:MAG: 4Fe-4S dicluster domain-containing protein [candidate division WOR-3 bacterium]|nr:MAG: 4Fe-4S dicluster domain-containing protein [candidate division WOR-3 bacterium]